MKTALHLVFLLLLILNSAISTEITYSNLKNFWESTYDTDQDGQAGL